MSVVIKAVYWRNELARAPSYDFERRERKKAKDAKRAEKTKSKADKKAGTENAEGVSAQRAVDEVDIARR